MCIKRQYTSSKILDLQNLEKVYLQDIMKH